MRTSAVGKRRLIVQASLLRLRSHPASNQTGSIYGVLELQDWTDGAPPATKTAADFAASERWTAAEFNALLNE
jgi:hypothetical protein